MDLETIIGIGLVAWIVLLMWWSYRLRQKQKVEDTN